MPNLPIYKFTIYHLQHSIHCQDPENIAISKSDRNFCPHFILAVGTEETTQVSEK